ncbi:MAG: hypothetical protein IK045_00835 [Bacteroidales bacterium]|nr:hypothetical protein [Bacteroidales bacterium]
MRKTALYTTIIAIASIVLSCQKGSVQPAIEDNGMLFTSSLPAVRSHFAPGSTSVLEWDNDDRAAVCSIYAFDGNGDELSNPDKILTQTWESMSAEVNTNNKREATFRSNKARKAWVGGDDDSKTGQFAFLAFYPATNFTSELVTADDESFYGSAFNNSMWIRANVPSTQYLDDFGRGQICYDFAREAAEMPNYLYGRDQIIAGSRTVAFDNFKPRNAMLSFTLSTDETPFEVREIMVEAVGDPGFDYRISGDCLLSQYGDIRNAGLVPGYNPDSYGYSNTIWVYSRGTQGYIFEIGPTPNEIPFNVVIIPSPERISWAENPEADGLPDPDNTPITIKISALDTHSIPLVAGTITSPNGFRAGKKYNFTLKLTSLLNPSAGNAGDYTEEEW